MATSIDYRFSLYNEKGMDLVRADMFFPKLIGTLTLRQSDLGRLFVVAEDGKVLDAADAGRNWSLNELRATGLRNVGSGGGFGAVETPGEHLTPPTYKYQFAVYGDDRSPSLLAAVIHGWGAARNNTKLEMADLLVHSMIGGQDYKMAQLYAQRAALPASWRYLTGDYVYPNTQFAGLPCTVTFRCRKTGGGELAGFGQVSVSRGLLYVEMTAHTEMELHFYDLAGVPWEYLQKCSSARQPEGYGVVGYAYEPLMTQYALPVPARVGGNPADPADSFNSRTQSWLEIGAMVRGRWMFPPGGDTRISGLAAGLLQDDLANKNRLTLFLEGNASATLRYETFNNARPYLRLLPNAGKLKKGDQITAAKPASAHGAIYTVRCGHEYAKVCSMMQHTCGGLMQLSSGGLMSAAAGAENFSFWGSQIGNRPSRINTGIHISDDYNGAPWNPTVRVKVSDAMEALGIGHYANGTGAGNTAEFLLREPTVLERFNMWLQTHLPSVASLFQAGSSARGGSSPVYVSVPNADYDPKLELKRSNQLRRHHQILAQEEAVRQMRNGEGFAEFTTMDNAAMRQMENELNARRSLLEMIESITDGTEVHHAYRVPFWGMPAFRHSNDRLEVYQPATLLNGNPKAQPPQYVPENWILCRTPV